MRITINYDGYVNSLSTRGFNLVLGIEILTIDHFNSFWFFLGHPVDAEKKNDSANSSSKQSRVQSGCLYAVQVIKDL